MRDIKIRLDLIAFIAFLGLLLAFVGCILSMTAYPKAVNWSFVLLFIVAMVAAVLNMLPFGNAKIALLNVVLGIVTILDAFLIYTSVVEMIGSGSVKFTDINIGVWLTFVGSVIYTIFNIPDYLGKKRAQQ